MGPFWVWNIPHLQHEYHCASCVLMWPLKKKSNPVRVCVSWPGSNYEHCSLRFSLIQTKSWPQRCKAENITQMCETICIKLNELDRLALPPAVTLISIGLKGVVSLLGYDSSLCGGRSFFDQTKRLGNVIFHPPCSLHAATKWPAGSNHLKAIRESPSISLNVCWPL